MHIEKDTDHGIGGCEKNPPNTSSCIMMSNVGALPDLEIPLDGLTVITGRNDTGKSTILKTIYCMIRPATGFAELRRESAEEILRCVVSDVLGFNSARGKDLDELMELADGIPADKIPWSHRDNLRLVLEPPSGRLDSGLYGETVGYHIGNEFGKLDQFPNQTRARETKVEIELGDEHCTFVLKRGLIDWTGDIRPFPKVLLYDTPLVMNPPIPKAPEDHVSTMCQLIHGPKEFNMFQESMIRMGKTRFDRLAYEIIGGFLINDCCVYLRRDGVKIDIRNMSAGIKLFASLKALSDKGHIETGTVLLLDEPESHMHPEHINILTDVITIMVTDMRVRVVITTCSPQLLMAIEGRIAKEGIHGRFFHLSKTEDSVEFSETTDRLEVVYKEMAGPIVDAKLSLDGDWT